MGFKGRARLGLLGVLAIGACTETKPEPLAPDEETRPAVLTWVDCAVQVSEGVMTCEPGGAPGSARAGANMSLIVGSQHQFVRLANTPPTTSDDTWTANVTVQNLTLQPFGTLDGTNKDPKGVRVFFHKQPSNGVVVVNHTGSEAFTGSTPQKFYEYSGAVLGADEILTPGETSAAVPWQFKLNGATTFRFSVLVSTEVPNRTGYGVHLTRIDPGEFHSCGDGADGNVYCWGRNHWGQLGNGTGSDRTTPSRVVAGVGLQKVAAGGSHTCALGTDDAIYCWGFNGGGQFGRRDPTSSTMPVQLTAPSGITWTKVTAGIQFTCAEALDGSGNSRVYCWGSNLYGEVGIGSGDWVYTPREVVVSGVRLSGVTAGSYHTCALGDNGRAYCWGRNSWGEVGNGTQNLQTTPAAVNAPADVQFRRLSAGGNHTCGETLDGDLYCWGYNAAFAYGLSGSSNSPRLVPAPAGVTLSGVATAEGSTCALGSDGSGQHVYCWGSTFSGSLGLGSITSITAPTKVSLPADVTPMVIQGQLQMMCAGTSNAGYCWGRNGYGQIGNGSISDQNRPALVAGTR